MQGHAEGLEAKSPRPAGSPTRPAQHPSRGAAAGDAAPAPHAGQEGMAGARGRPTLVTAAQVALVSGSGSELLAARRVPAPGAAASSPASPAGGAGGRGRSRHKPRPRTPRGPPLLPHPPTALRAPKGWSRGGHPRPGRAHTRRRSAAGIGAAPGDQAEAGDSRTRPAGGPAGASLCRTRQGTRPPEPPSPLGICHRELCEN